MSERKTGVFGTVKDEDTSRKFDYLRNVTDSDPDTIYNLLFKEFDEENNR